MAVWIIIALWGFYRGAMRTVISISIIIISIAAAVYVSPRVNELLASSRTVSEYAAEQADTFVEARIDSLSNGSSDLRWTQYLPLPSGVRDVIAEGDPAVIGALLGTDSVKSYLGELVAGFLIRVVSIVATFLLAYLAMFVVRLIFNSIAEAPYISGLNHVAGLFLGVAKGAVIIWIVFALLRVSSMVKGPGTGLLAQIRESDLLTIMYAYNPVFTILPRLLGLIHV